ncbi:MAG: NlpC/P60 family protein [Proteobacteria bacterium]|nr:NlpC/P60 family protein [Pseudomonadota bacterium]
MEITDKILIVTVPVADLRGKPVDAKPAYIHDDLQETQVLYNETLWYLDEIDDWYYVEAMEQQKNTYRGYPGWIRKAGVAMINALATYNAVVKNKTARILKSQSENAGILMTVSIGTKFTVNETANKEYYAVILADNKRGYISKDDVNGTEANLNERMLRKAIVSTGRLFLGTPYLWGGRSMFMTQLPGGRQKVDNSIFNIQRSTPNAINTGVDCSGLTNLVYRVNNIDIPRDAQEQWMATKKVSCNRLKPGDLIFVSAEDRPDFINHVMLNIGSERFIEAAETGNTVMVNTFMKRFGEGFNQLAEQDFIIHNKQIHFGSVI